MRARSSVRFLVLGASGFIGRHVVGELLAAGHDVTGAARRPERLARGFPSIETVALDLAAMPDEAKLADCLRGVDVLVNAAGLLDGPGLAAVHVDGPRALYAAAVAAGVKRVVLISAISAREGVATGYARTKLEGERVLCDAGVPWTILRPSLVVAKGSYGGTSVLRGLAGLPLVTPTMPLGDARFSPIHARDLARAIIVVAEGAGFAGRTLEPAGPDTATLQELVRAYRRWLGFAPALEVPIPAVLARFSGRVGDWLDGGPISSASLDQLAAGNAGDGAGFAQAIGFRPRGLSTVLATEPADVQERWHARLFFAAILTKAVLVLIWLVSALVGLLAGQDMAAAFASSLGLPDAMVWPLLVATCLLDVAAAALLVFDRRGRLALWFQLVLVVGYTVGLSVAMPLLWADPFGPLLKNLAVLMLIGVNAVLSESR